MKKGGGCWKYTCHRESEWSFEDKFDYPPKYCKYYKQKRDCKWYAVKTNADKVRQMSDEELADYLDGVCHDLWQMFVADPQKMWLDWLRREAKDD